MPCTASSRLLSASRLRAFPSASAFSFARSSSVIADHGFFGFAAAPQHEKQFFATAFSRREEEEEGTTPERGRRVDARNAPGGVET